MGTSLDESARENCEALYLSQESEFRSCFPIVSTDDFLTACMKSKADYCKIAKAYHFTCRMKGAPITMPSECLTCTAMGTKSGYQGSTQLDVTGNDIVFILQESKCLNAKTVGKFLRKFFKSKIMEPPSKKSKQNNYYRVGYGGPGGREDPHTDTLTTKENNISTDKKNEVAKRIKHVIASADGTPSDGLHAVSYATKLPFRCPSNTHSSFVRRMQRRLSEKSIRGCSSPPRETNILPPYAFEEHCGQQES